MLQIPCSARPPVSFFVSSAIMSASTNACASALREQEPMRPFDARGIGGHFLDRPKYREAVAAHAEGKLVPHVACVTCKLAVDLGRFVDIADAKEFMISGMCLTCQELVFGTANRLPEWAR